MTEQEINEAIAELCGPKLFVLHKPIHDPFGYYKENAHGYTANLSEAWKVTAEVAAKHVSGRQDDPDRVVAEPAPIRNYYGDSNAMREAEECIPAEKRSDYLGALAAATGYNTPGKTWEDAMWDWHHATAPQRAEAFLRVHEKWKE